MGSQIDFIFRAIRKKNEYINNHRHDCMELVYYISGKGSTSISGTVYEYAAGDFTIIEADTLHDEQSVENTEVLFIGFNKNTTNICLKNGIYRDDTGSKIIHLMENIRQEIFEQPLHYKEKSHLLLDQLIIEIDRMQNASGKKSADLSYIIRYIDENYSQRINIKTMADLSGYSYHHFRHIYKKVTGLSPINYVLVKRLQQAKYLLESTRLSIIEISIECGFSTESQFSSIFKKKIGVNPRVYRKFNNQKF